MLNTFNARLVNIERWVTAFSLLLMLLLSIFQMLARNFFDIGFSEIDIINRNLLVVCGMMGAVLATSHHQHIKIDALTTVLNSKTMAYLRVPVLLFSTIVCALMCNYSITFVQDEWQYAPANERWIVPFTLIYPIGFALLSLHFFMLCPKSQQTITTQPPKPNQ